MRQGGVRPMAAVHKVQPSTRQHAGRFTWAGPPLGIPMHRSDWKYATMKTRGLYQDISVLHFAA